MESNEAASVILNLMDLDKVPNQHPVRDKQKVLSENYQQKVASIGVRRKRSSHQHHSFGMNTSEKDKSEDVLEVFKALRRSKHHNPSKGNGKENPSSSKNSQLADGLLQEICYPENQYRKQISCHMNFVKPSSRSFSKISEEISMQSGNVANGAFHTASTSFFRGNEVLANDMLKPASNISVNEIQFNSPIFCSDGSYIGSQARRKTLEQRDVTKKVHELRPFGRDCAHNQLHMIWEKGNGARNLTHQRGYGNVRIKAGDNYSFARRVPRPLCSASGLADNCGTMNQDILFHRYWGLRKNSSSSWSSWNSKNQNNDQKECLEDVNLSSGGEKFPSFCSYFNSDHTEENCISHKSEKGCYENNLSDKITMPHQLPSSSSSPTFIDRQILQERRVMNDEVKNRKYDDSNLFQQNVESLESSVEFLASDGTVEVVDWTHSPTEHQSKSTAFILSQEIDCLNHTSYTSKQQDRSDFKEGSDHSFCHEVHSDSLGSSVESYEPSPISVLDPLFGEDIQIGYRSEDNIYDSSEVDDEECGLNVSSDEDCENEYAHNSKEKKEIAGLVRAEESRDFSYVVEVLTEASIFNRNLRTDFSTWHSSQCPISPSVFENLEKKFGQQQFWSRSERKLLFDRINIGLIQILEPCLFVPIWEKSTLRRLNVELSQDIIEDEMWGLLVAQEKKVSNEFADHTLEGKIRWIELVEDVEDIVTEIVNLVTEELANEIVFSVNF